MSLRHSSWTVVALMALLCGKGTSEEPKTAPAVPGGSQGQGVLAGNGLRKVGQSFVLADEAAMSKRLREIEMQQKKVREAQQKAYAAETKVEQKKQVMMAYAQQRRALNAELAGNLPAERHNRIVLLMNELSDRLNLMEKSDQLEKEAKAARAAATQVSEQYVESLLQLRKQYNEVKAKYGKLSADSGVQKAIAEASKDSSTPLKLGPSVTMVTLDKNLKRLEGGVLSDTIQLRKSESDLWEVAVTINGQKSADMAIDTGASMISLPAKTAQQLGLSPSSSAPTIRCVLADGRTVDAKLVYAKSVRVGRFTVENVECGIMPESAIAATALLGLSFLKHFDFKIDNAKGTLTITQVETPGGRKSHVAYRDNKDEPSKPKDVLDGPAGSPADSTAEGKPEGKPDERLAALLKLDGDHEKEGFTVQRQGGSEIRFTPCKQGPVSSLVKRFGEPDEMVKLPRKSPDPNQQAVPWKMYSWGTVHVMVDETGRTRYYAVIKE